MKKVVTPPKEKEVITGQVIIPVTNKEVDMNKLAFCVASHETANCTLGYGSQYNNCFGIKNGNTAPCKKIGNSRMCIYNNPEESYVAFKKIWTETGYNGLPNLQKAIVWSGNDRPQAWLTNVMSCYNK